MDSFNIWPFSVSMLNFWGITVFCKEPCGVGISLVRSLRVIALWVVVPAQLAGRWSPFSLWRIWWQSWPHFFAEMPFIQTLYVQPVWRWIWFVCICLTFKESQWHKTSEKLPKRNPQHSKCFFFTLAISQTFLLKSLVSPPVDPFYLDGIFRVRIIDRRSAARHLHRLVVCVRCTGRFARCRGGVGENRVFGAEWGGHGVDQFFQDAEGKIRKAKIGLKKQEKNICKFKWSKW